MPLWKGRFFVPERSSVEEKNGVQIFTISYSGEKFDSKEEFENYQRLYQEPLWTCQCTGHINLTHEEAWQSEVSTREAIRKKFPACFEKAVLEIVHHSTDTLDALVEKSSKLLYEYLVIGEPVTLRIVAGGQSIAGVIAKIESSESIKPGCSPSSDKENKDTKLKSVGCSPKKGTPLKLLPLKYGIKLNNEEKIINGVPANDLVRETRVPNKDLIKLFIRCFSARSGSQSGTPWVVERSVRQQYQIANKLSDLILNNAKSLGTNKRVIDEALKEVAVRSMNKRRKSSMVTSSPVRYGSGKKHFLEDKSTSAKGRLKKGKSSKNITKSHTPKKGRDGQVKKNSFKSEQVESSSDEDISLAELKRSPQKLTPKKMERKALDDNSKNARGRPRKRKGEDIEHLPKKRMKQMTLFDMKGKKCSTTTATPSKSPAKNTPTTPRHPPIVHKLLKAIKQNNCTSLVAQLVTRCAKELNDRQRQVLPDHIKDRVQERWAKIQEKKMMEQMTPEEKEKYLKKKHKEACKKAMDKIKNMKKKFEDTHLTLQPLPSPQLLSTPENMPNELFGDVIMLAEFINCYKPLLMPESKELISAGAMMQALCESSGQAVQTLGQLLTVLLQTYILQDVSVQGTKELGIPISDIPVNSYTASELVRLCITHEVSQRRDEEESDDEDDRESNQLRQVPEEVLSQLESNEVYELSIHDKLSLLLGICDRVLASDTVQDYMAERQNDASELWRTRNQMLKEKNDILREEKQKRKEERKNKGAETKQESKENGVTGTNEDAAGDMASVVKRRRAMAARMQEEKQNERKRKEKELEEYRRQRDLEQLEKNFTEGVQRARLVMRQTPLGTDRNHDRYWYFPATHPGLLIEKGWVCTDINYSVQKEIQSDSESEAESSSESEAEEETAKPTKKGRVKRPRCLDKTVPHRGQNLWFVYDTPTSIDALMDALHPQGSREGRLKEQLMKHVSTLKDVILKREPEVLEPSVSSLDAFKTELEDVELRLKNGGLGGVADPESWKKNLEEAQSIKELGTCLITVQESIVDKFVKGILMKDKTENGEEKSIGEKQWQEAIQTCTTYSRLHVLLGMFDSSIKWEKSAENAKCKICRRKDEEFLLLCDECNQAFHMYCLRPALHTVPEGDWFCAACAPTQRRVRVGRRSAEDLSETEAASDSESLVHEDQCAVCSGKEQLHSCATCPSVFHLDCHEPPLRRPPRNTWRCMQCVSGIRIRRSRRAAAKKKKHYSDDFVEEWEDEEEAEKKQRRQAREALLNGTKEDTSKTRAERYRNRCWSPDETENSDDDSVSTEPSYPITDSQVVSQPTSSTTPPKAAVLQKSPAKSSEDDKTGVSPKMNGHVDKKQQEAKHISDILGRLRRNKNAWPFQDPVDASAVPDYYEIVKNPIDLKSMKDKLDSGKYENAQDFVDDMALLFNNCELYNKPDTLVFKCIAPLEKIFRDNHRRLLPYTWYPRDGRRSLHNVATDHDYL